MFPVSMQDNVKDRLNDHNIIIILPIHDQLHGDEFYLLC